MASSTFHVKLLILHCCVKICMPQNSADPDDELMTMISDVNIKFFVVPDIESKNPI